MDTVQSDANNRGGVLAEVQALYPVPPFSWLVPLWSYACGVIASSGTSWTGRNLLLFLLGVLLVGPLLGKAREASERIRVYKVLATDSHCATDTSQKSGASIPYTLPGSASDRLVLWVRVASARLHQGTPELGTLLLQLAGSTVFSLTVAAVLGPRALTLATAALVCAYTRTLFRERSVAGGAASAMAVFLPVFFSWLIGHAAYAAICPESALVGAGFALSLCNCLQVHRTGQGIRYLLLPQIVVSAYFVFAGQPVAAVGVLLLAFTQLLWAPLLQTPAGRTAYFRAIELPLAASMLLSAWTLGYAP